MIRQFVAAPLGSGDTVEEQLTGEAEHGGLQIVAYPLKKEVWERMQRERRQYVDLEMLVCADRVAMPSAPDMGLTAGGRMRQEIYEDEQAFENWDLRNSSRCFVHITNSLAWKGIIGSVPPTRPPTAEDYTRAGLPWFSYYDRERKALEGSPRLGEVRPVGEEDEIIADPLPIDLSPGRKGIVREGSF